MKDDSEGAARRLGEIDFSECEREPIHAPLSIQRYGALIVVDEDGFVLAASRSCERMLDLTPESLLDAEWKLLLLAQKLDQDEIPEGPDYNFQNLSIDGQTMEVAAHRHKGRTFWEFQFPVPDSDSPAVAAGDWAAIKSCEQAANFFRASQVATETYKRLTGYDRVMVYRFHPDWSGEVIAEARNEKALPFLGLRYPATDIPSQARALFLMNPTRVIADVAASESPLIVREGEPAPDCSFSRLRGTSPYHLEYLTNMGVGASIVHALVVEGKLWGLIVGHHDQPRLLSGGLVSRGLELANELSQVIEKDLLKHREELMARVDSVEKKMQEVLMGLSPAKALRELFFGELALSHLFVAHGAAIYLDRDNMAGAGEIPAPEQLAQLSERVDASASSCIESSAMLEDFGISCRTAGVLGTKVDLCGESMYVFLFRSETKTEVLWGGDPTEAAIVDASDRLKPRKSFALWRESVRDQSRPWLEEEVQMLGGLRRGMERWTVTRGLSQASMREGCEELRTLEFELGILADLMLSTTSDGLALAVDEGETLTPEILHVNSGMFRILDIPRERSDFREIAASLAAAGFHLEYLNRPEAEFECWVPRIGHRRFRSLRNTALFICTPQGTRKLGVIELKDMTLNDRLLEAMTVARDQARRVADSHQKIMSNLNHEMRTPLNAILGLSELLLLQESSGSDDTLDFVKRIEKAGQHLLRLVEDVLEVTKFDEGKIRLTSEEGVGLETLVEETFSLVQHLAFEKSIELVSEVGEVSDVGGKVVLDVDRTRMQQVFNNLVMNAVKYSPNNTKVTLLARSSRQKGLEIIVRDEGVGIPEESFATIFEPFQRLVDPEAGYIEGSGLGLSMVKSIVELHGGRVRVESEVQRGSSFIVQLPSSRVKLVQS